MANPSKSDQVSGCNDDNDLPQLSEDTMNIVMEFYKEQEEREKKLQEIAEGIIPDSFEEDWNLSQFWYTQETSDALAEECMKRSNNKELIACVSCPTLYRSLKKLPDGAEKKLFEFDTRFAVYKDDFVFYDYRSPLEVPKHLREKFSVIVADPPYLSEDCLTKTAITVKFLAKPDAKIIFCTGAVMEDTVERLLKLKRCSFPIKHYKRLSNPFVCYANYHLDSTCKAS